MECILNDVMVIFKYITEKDVFQKFYRNLLASRLVNDTSVSHDLEGSMISKLKVSRLVNDTLYHMTWRAA